jgi:triphosphatase
VFIKRVVRPVAHGKANGAGMTVLAKDLQQRREEAFARACAAVESSRFRRLVLDAACWIEAGDWTRNPDDLTRLLREQPIVGAAADELRRRWKKMLKAGAQLGELDPQRRHKIRLLIRARTGEGRKRAKERGVKFGRPAALTPDQRQEVL